MWHRWKRRGISTGFWQGNMKKNAWMTTKLSNVTTSLLCWGQSLHMKWLNILETGCSPTLYFDWLLHFPLFQLLILRTILASHSGSAFLISVLILSSYLGLCNIIWSLTFMVFTIIFYAFCIFIHVTYPAHLIFFNLMTATFVICKSASSLLCTFLLTLYIEGYSIPDHKQMQR